MNVMTRHGGALLLALPVFIYIIAARLLTDPSGPWDLSVIDGARLLFIDDAYRFFIARSAFVDAELYAWGYVQPVWLLIQGAVAFLSDGQLGLVRMINSAAGASTAVATFFLSRRLGAGRLPAIVSSAILLSMPVFFFISVSFYGELWLGFGYVIALLFWLNNRQRSALVVFSLLPLLRQEGLFIILPLWFWLLAGKRWRDALFLFAPGTVYALYLAVVLFPEWQDYLAWRLQIREVLQELIPGMQSGFRPDVIFRFFSTFNFFWLFPALFAFSSRRFLDVWYLWSGAALWLLLILSSMVLGNTSYESRYFYPLLPLLGLGFAWSLTFLVGKLHGKRCWKTLAVCVLGCLLMAEHLLQFDPLKANMGDRRWPIAGVPALHAAPPGLSGAVEEDRARMASRIEELVSDYPDRDQLLVNDYSLFYHLDPVPLDGRVRVVYVPTSVTEAASMGGVFWGMHPGGKQAGFYRLNLGPGKDGSAIFAGDLTPLGWLPAGVAGKYRAHLVGYQLVPSPIGG